MLPNRGLGSLIRAELLPTTNTVITADEGECCGRSNILKLLGLQGVGSDGMKARCHRGTHEAGFPFCSKFVFCRQ